MFNNAVNFKPDAGDIFVVTYPKCGKTWMQNILHLIRNNGVPIQKGDVLLVGLFVLKIGPTDSLEPIYPMI